MSKFIKYVKNHLIFILIIILAISLEIGILNHGFFTTVFQRLIEKPLIFSDGSLKDFSYNNGYLVAESEDPNITFNQINERVRYISINCKNSNPDALAQVFYKQAGEGYSEANSVIFPLSKDVSIISLPRTMKISALRFDLTNQQGDILSCTGLEINPNIVLIPHYGCLFFLAIGISGLFWGGKLFSSRTSGLIWKNLVENGMLLFIILIIFLDFTYPPTITFDSAQYLFLSNIIRSGNWGNWDPLRKLIFPLNILGSLKIFGYQLNALLIPMIAAHLTLFVFSYWIIIDIIKPKTQWFKFLILLFIFFIIAVDPTIFGYFHTLLTEYLAATIAIICSFLAMRVYNAKLFSRSFFIYSAFLIMFVPITWHLKQPYIGAAFFPLILVAILIVIRKLSRKTILYTILTITIGLLLIFSTNLLWEHFIESKSAILQEDRLISSQIDSSLEQNKQSLKENPVEFFSDKVSDYLLSINFKTRDYANEEPKNSLTYGFQNSLIAHRMYLNRGSTNIIYEHPPFDEYTKYFITHYSPPNLINKMFLLRLDISHFLFTFTYFLTPVFFIMVLIFWMLKKNTLKAAFIIMSGTAMFNAFGHLIIWPIDRYLFLGYPLNLLILIILFFQGFKLIQLHFEPIIFPSAELTTGSLAKKD